MTRFRSAAGAGLVLLAAASLVPATQPPGASAAPPEKALDVIPRNGFLVVSVKVAQVWDHPGMKPLRDWAGTQTGGTLERVVGVAPADLDRVTVLLPAFAREGPAEPVVLLTTRKPYNEARVVKHLLGDQPGGRNDARRVGNVVNLPRGEFRAVVLADDKTLVFLPGDLRGGEGAAALVGQLLARTPTGPLADAIKVAEAHPVAVGLDVPQLAAALRGDAGRELVPYAALTRATAATLTADLEKGVKVRLALAFPDAAAAKRAGPVLEEALATLAAELDRTTKTQQDRGDEGKAGAVLFGWLRDLLKGAKVEVADATVTAMADAPFDEVVTQLAAVLPKSLAFAANSAQASNNLKQLLLALHNYHAVYDTFPGDVVPDKKAAWSWRVQILPFVEQDALYRQLDMQLPWDDPKNKAVLEKAEMPKVFEVPGRPAPKGQTYWRVFTQPKKAKAGGGQPWHVEGERGPRIASITDGTSNSFAVVEAGEAVPWYAPDVLAYDGKLPLPPLGAKGADRFLAGMGDGSVRRVPTKTDEKALRAAITINGGEVQALPEK